MLDPNQWPNGITPAVAVVIPFYNGAAFIERALRSVYAQSMPAAEVVVVNDGSQPQEREFLHQIQPRYGFKLIDQENSGQAAARNAGVAAASAPYICFLDQDDFYLEHHILLLTQAIPDGGSSLGYVYGELWEADSQGLIIRHWMVRDSGRHPKQDLFDMLCCDMFVLPSATLVSRAAFEAVGGFDTQFTGYEDDDLFLRIFRAGYTSHFVDQAVTVWCLHPGNTTFSMTMARSRLRYLKKQAAACPDEPKRHRYYLRDCLVPRFGHYFMGQALQCARSGNENQTETRAILDEYAALVLANPFVAPRAKLKLRIILRLVHQRQRWLLRLIIGTLVRLPKMNWLRHLLTVTV
jgi:glycosyltransferase involved in cell wall biosynthesis